MADAAKGKTLVSTSLFLIVALTIGLSALGGEGSSPATLYGRPILAFLGALLVWQGRLWARLLLLFLGLGIIVAGPMTWAKGLGPTTTGGALAWAASGLYVASLIALYFSKDAKAHFASLGVPRPSASSNTPA